MPTPRCKPEAVLVEAEARPSSGPWLARRPGRELQSMAASVLVEAALQSLNTHPNQRVWVFHLSFDYLMLLLLF